MRYVLSAFVLARPRAIGGAGSTISHRKCVALIVKAYAARLRLDPGAFSGHSLRLVTGIDRQTGTPTTSMKRSQGIRL